MAVANEAEGQAEAQRRIKACREARADTLDLGGLQLTRVPEELADLVNLTSLDLWDNGIGTDGARALAGLANLTSLNLGSNQIGDDGAKALSGLANLIALNLWGNKIGADGARALSGLVSIASLNFRWNKVGADGARALASLANLTSLDLGWNEIGADGARALSGLVKLTSLDLENGLIGDDGARGLSELVNLTSLNLQLNRICDTGARALAALVNLTSLDLGNNSIGDDGAGALAALVNLTSLSLFNNNIRADGVAALSGFVNLTSLNLAHNDIGADGARALAGLVNLTSLDLSRTGVEDLSPLLNLEKLSRLDCSGCRLDKPMPELWQKPSLKRVVLYEANLPGVPTEVLSPNSHTSCLETLRAHFKDLAGGEAEVTDVKFMILGNGRVGKTQLCRRLRGEPYDAAVTSTHGIEISSAPLARAPGEPPMATLRIWDFGGQDIYHGTHALFLKSRAIFPVVWTPVSEETQFHDHGGFTFRNQPLGYWLAYVRSMGGRDSPLLVIQAQCDLPEDERLSPPSPLGALDAFPFKKVLHYSAKTDRGRAAVDETLADAVTWLRRNLGVDKIGMGRAKVKARLETMRDNDAGLPPAKRRRRLVTQAEFLRLCEKAGNISSPEALLDYLHNCGTVFYRAGLFGDRIILDQAWALDAVYAVFDRARSYPNLQRYRGRFTRSDLGQWVWDARKHSVKEQELFLSLMQQCGICFGLRWGDDKRNIEAEYIAPDLLPGRDDPEIASELQQKWEDRRDAEATLAYELLPPGLMRSLISQVGGEAGLAAEYWRDGFYFYDQKTRSKALVEQCWTTGWAGEIRVETQGGQAPVLLERVLELIDNLHDRFGARPSGRNVSGGGTETRERPGKTGERPDELAPIKPAPAPVVDEEYYVSYAWGDSTREGREREAVVDRLCTEASAKGITIIRDKTAMGLGDRISKFMRRIGRGDRVFIVLSDKYLKSAYCMHELFEVWRNCREDDAEFIARTRVFGLPSAKIGKPVERAQYAIHWRKQFEEMDALVKKEGQFVLSDADNADYRRMTRFVNETANILKLVQDVLRPRTFEEFLKHGLGDPPS